jgi:hypothetical protein
MSFTLTQNLFKLMGNKSKGNVSGEDFSILYLLLQRQHHFTIKYARYEIEVKKINLMCDIVLGMVLFEKFLDAQPH